MIPLNIAPYSENTLNDGSPYAANFTQGKGFFTAPARRIVDAAYVREVSPTFTDYWTQPRLIWNSLTPAERQMVVNAARFEISNVKSKNVQKNAIMQFNRISNDLASRVAVGLGLPKPEPENTYYHDNKTSGISTFSEPLPNIKTLNIGILASTASPESLKQAAKLAAAFKAKGAVPKVIAESLQEGVDTVYTAADAVLFDGVIVVDGTRNLFLKGSSLFPAGRPGQIVRDAYNYGKPVAAVGAGSAGFQSAGVSNGKGVYTARSADDSFVNQFEGGLKQFKFLERFPIDGQ